MAVYGLSTFDSFARYDEMPATTAKHKKHMNLIALELQDKTDEEVAADSTAHRDAMAGNANFPTPSPTAAVFNAKLLQYTDKLGDIAQAEIDLVTLRSEKEQLRGEVGTLLTARANNVEEVAAGDTAKILSAGFKLRAAGTPTTSLGKPLNVVATMGDQEGEIDVACDAVKKARNYSYHCREHIEGQVPGPWSEAKFSSKSFATLTGLVSGRKYAFRLRAFGPNDTVSPWSDEAVCMAP